MKKSFVTLEYLLKVAAVVIIWWLGLHISWIAETFIMLEVFSHMFQTAQARVAEAMDSAFGFLQKLENKT